MYILRSHHSIIGLLLGVISIMQRAIGGFSTRGIKRFIQVDWC